MIIYLVDKKQSVIYNTLNVLYEINTKMQYGGRVFYD